METSRSSDYLPQPLRTSLDVSVSTDVFHKSSSTKHIPWASSKSVTYSPSEVRIPISNENDLINAVLYTNVGRCRRNSDQTIEERIGPSHRDWNKSRQSRSLKHSRTSRWTEPSVRPWCRLTASFRRIGRATMPATLYKRSLSQSAKHLETDGNEPNVPGVHFKCVDTQTEDLSSYCSLSSQNEGRLSTSALLKEQFFSFFQPSGNKLAKKLFGTKMALDRERLRQEEQGKWIIHPCSNCRFYWDLIMLMILIANLIILPVAISFFNEELSLQWIVFNCLSDAIFLIDIVVNFRTGLIRDNYVDEIVLSPKEIARHYLRTWFILDLISSLPLDYIYFIFHEKDKISPFVQAGRALRFLRLAKLLSLIRLLRLSRLVRYVNQCEELLNVANKFIGIFNLVLVLLLLSHWSACLQFLIPMLNDFPVNCWVSKCKLQNAHWFDQYTWALFKAMSHMLSIGYGRFPPTNSTEVWVTLVSIMTGATGYALFIGHAAALIQSFDWSKRVYREKFKQVEEYMAFRKLPRALRERVESYFQHKYKGKIFNEKEIFSELSECLKEQIVNYNCRALVAAVPFFTFADQNFVTEVVIKLQSEVFQPLDLIIKEGTTGSKMYFIQEGIVDIVKRDGEVVTSLSDGSYFGEICLLTNARRVASVRAATYCNLYSLDRVSFLEVLHHYPLMRRTMESVAAERLNKIGRDPRSISQRKDLYDDLCLVKEIVDQAEEESNNAELGLDGGNRGLACAAARRQVIVERFQRALKKLKNHDIKQALSLQEESVIDGDTVIGSNPDDGVMISEQLEQRMDTDEGPSNRTVAATSQNVADDIPFIDTSNISKMTSDS